MSKKVKGKEIVSKVGMSENNVLGELIGTTLGEGNILFIQLWAKIVNNRGCFRN